MKKSEMLKFGFFFLSGGARSSMLYFAGFQKGASMQNAHQIVIAEVREAAPMPRRVVYAVDPAIAKVLDESELEHLCRVAVSQFLGKLPMDNFLFHVLPLDMGTPPWGGSVQPVELTI